MISVYRQIEKLRNAYVWHNKWLLSPSVPAWINYNMGQFPYLFSFNEAMYSQLLDDNMSFLVKQLEYP